MKICSIPTSIILSALLSLTIKAVKEKEDGTSSDQFFSKWQSRPRSSREPRPTWYVKDVGLALDAQGKLHEAKQHFEQALKMKRELYENSRNPAMKESIKIFYVPGFLRLTKNSLS